GLSCVLQPGHGACAAERRMCKVWVVMILGRGRCFARGPTAVHNMGRVVRDSHPGEQGERAADPEVLTPASKERPPGTPRFVFAEVRSLSVPTPADDFAKKTTKIKS